MMGSEARLKSSAELQVRRDTVALLTHYNECFSTPWYYACSLVEDNQHSLAAAMGVTCSQMLRILKMFDVAKDWKNSVIIKKKLADWRKDSDMASFIEMDDRINVSQSKCTGTKSKYVFLLLGKCHEKDHFKLPIKQGRKETPAHTSNDGRLFRKLKSNLRSSMEHFDRVQAPGEDPLNGSSASGDAGEGDTEITRGVADDANGIASVSGCAGSSSLGSSTSTGMSTSTSGWASAGASAGASGSRSSTGLLSVEHSVITQRCNQIINNYKKLHHNAPSDVIEVIATDEDLSKSYPLLKLFNIPIVPLMIRMLAKEIMKLAKEKFDEDLLSTVSADGAGHEYTVMSVLKPENERSFKNNCRDKIRSLPNLLLKSTKFKNLTDADKRDAQETHIRDIRKWCIEALLDNDTSTQDAFRAVARKKLRMVDKKKMKAADIGAMLKLFNILPTSFLGMKSFMETFWDFQMFDSKTSIRLLHHDAVVPTAGVTDDELKIEYWFKEIKDVLLLFLRDQGRYDLRTIRKMQRIHMIFACDHGKEKSRSAVKILLMDDDSDDSKVLKTSVASVGNIDHTKDDYDILKDTIFPEFDRMIKELQECYVCTNDLKDYFIPNNDDDDALLLSQKSVRVKIFVCSDYKFVAEVQGKPNRAGHWCPFCDISMDSIKQDSTNRGTLWTIERWREVLALNSKVSSINRGVVKEPLLTSVAPSEYLIAILHQLLGTGNDIRKEIYNVADTMFETWSQELILKHDELVAAMVDRDTKRDARKQNEHAIEHLERTQTNLAQNYHILLLHNNQDMHNTFVQQQAAIANHINVLQNNKDLLHTRAVAAGKEYTKLNQKLREQMKGRKFRDKPLKADINRVFKKYSIVPQQYHGGDFVGPHVRKFMEKANEICSDITDIFKSVPINMRRKRKRGTDNEVEVMNDEQIERKMNKISDLLLLADTIYSVSHAAPGTLTDEEINEVGSVVRIFSTLWRSSGLSATIKVHIIESHLIAYLRRFRGLGSYEESFIEMAHQEGVKMERRSANVKHTGTKANLHSSWERLGSNPEVERSVDTYHNTRKRRKLDDSRVVQANNEKERRQQIKVENRQTARNNHVELLVQNDGN